MSKDMMSELLQECLAAYESGLSPEECLSAYPTHRRELEPLLRQALCLRVSYAAAPREEFVAKSKAAFMFAAGAEVSKALAAEPSERFVAEARHHLMFLAGREASQAFAAQPDESFVSNARGRLIIAAGANAQEALRAVPPPRMPFWWNTRRKLLEAASMQQRPEPVRRPLFSGMALRAGFSMAALVLVFAVAGFAYMVGQRPTTSDASEIASLQQELNTIEARNDAGLPVSETQVSSLLQRTTELADKLKDKPAAPTAAKLPALIDRQLTVLDKVYSDTPAPASVVQAQLQLDDQKTKLLASGQTTPVVPAAAASTSTPAAPTSTPSITPTAVSTPVLPPPVANQARISVLPDGRVEIRTATLRFIAPKDWNIGGISTDGGSPVVIGNTIAIGGAGAVVFVYTNGIIEANIAGQQVFLRTVDPFGRVSLITADDLVAKAGPISQELPFTLRQILASFEMAPSAAPVLPPPGPPIVNTPVPTSTTAPAATATPAVTSTPAPATATQAPATATSTPVPPTATRVPSTPPPAATP